MNILKIKQKLIKSLSNKHNIGVIYSLIQSNYLDDLLSKINLENISLFLDNLDILLDYFVCSFPILNNKEKYISLLFDDNYTFFKKN